MKIVDLVCSAGRTGFYFDDQRAIKKGAGHDGVFYVGEPVTEGFTSVRQPGESISVMLILEDGSCVGTIGGGCMEAEVLRKARVMMHENNTGLKTKYVDMTGDDAEEEGMVCGGTIEVLLEPLWN